MSTTTSSGEESRRSVSWTSRVERGIFLVKRSKQLPRVDPSRATTIIITITSEERNPSVFFCRAWQSRSRLSIIITIRTWLFIIVSRTDEDDDVEWEEATRIIPSIERERHEKSGAFIRRRIDGRTNMHARTHARAGYAYTRFQTSSVSGERRRFSRGRKN